MKVLTVTNRKGGVGKTTLSRTLCEYFALERKLRVLAVDLDAQCSLSHLFLDMDIDKVGEQGARPPLHPEFDPDDYDPAEDPWEGRSSSADIFYQGEVVPYAVKYPAGAETLDILPGHSRSLTEVEEQDKPQLIQGVENRLREWVEGSGVRDFYDLLVIDTGPGSSPLAKSALRACTHILIPIEAEPQSIRGLYELISEIRHEDMRRTLETKVRIIGIQPNKVKARRQLHRGVLGSLKREFNNYLSPCILPDLVGFAERDADKAQPRSLFQLPPSNPARRHATEFCQYVESRLFEEDA